MRSCHAAAHGALILISCLVTPSVYGQTASPPGTGSPLFRHHLETPAITFELQYRGYGEENVVEARRHFLEGEIVGSFQGRFGDRLHYSLTPQIRFDNAGRTESGFVFSERTRARPLATFREAFAAWYGDVYEITVGKKIFSWGVGEGFRPADNLNPYDFLDVPAAEKIGIPALAMYRYGENVSTQLVYVPVFIPGRLPGTGNRWVFEDAETMEQIHETFGDWYTIVDGGRLLPPGVPKNAQYALKLNSSSLVMGWDLFLEYFQGHYSSGVLYLDQVVFPTGEPDTGLQAPRLIIKMVYPACREIAAGVSTTAGNWEFHAEGALHHTLDRQKDDSVSEYIAGFTHTLYDPGLPFLQELRGTVEYAGIAVTRERPSESRYSGAGFGRGLDNTLLTNLRLQFSGDTYLDLGTAVNLDPGDRYSWIAFSQRVWDRITLEVDCQVFAGPPESFFGGWDKNDRLVLRITGGF